MSSRMYTMINKGRHDKRSSATSTNQPAELKEALHHILFYLPLPLPLSSPLSLCVMALVWCTRSLCPGRTLVGGRVLICTAQLPINVPCSSFLVPLFASFVINSGHGRVSGERGTTAEGFSTAPANEQVLASVCVQLAHRVGRQENAWRVSWVALRNS